MWKCAYWSKIDKDSPFERVFACSILGFCTMCRFHFYSRHVMPPVGFIMAFMGGLVMDVSLVLGIILGVIGVSLAMVPSILGLVKDSIGTKNEIFFKAMQDQAEHDATNS